MGINIIFITLDSENRKIIENLKKSLDHDVTSRFTMETQEVKSHEDK